MKNIVNWLKNHLPTRESLAANRWTAPFSHHILRPELWRLNRRSVPRAVALGLLIAPIIPIAHTPIAALLAVPVRANIMIAAATTWLINPITIPPFYLGAHWVGQHLLRVNLGGFAGAAYATFAGTLTMAVIIASVGYLVTSLFWRLRIGRLWRRRSKSVAANR